MRNISIVCVGRLKEQFLRNACAEYSKRLGVFCKLTITEVLEERLTDNPSPAQIKAAISAEGRRILTKIDGKPTCIALCIEGSAMNSVEFAHYIEDMSVRGRPDVALIIGGSWGLSDEVKAAADLRLSLSKMTFPHQLTRVILLEQLYRTYQIISGGRYHK